MKPNFKIARCSYNVVENGVKVRKYTKNYYGRITLPNGQRKRIPLTSDRRTSQTKFLEIVRKHQVGELTTDDLNGKRSKKSLLQYLEDYKQHISLNGNKNWAKSQASKLKRLFKMTGAIFPNDMTYSKAVIALKEMKENPTGKMKKGLSLNTINNNIACYKAFFNWLVNTDQIPKNPLRRLVKSRVNEEDLVHQRRQMTLEEQEFLISTTKARVKLAKERICPKDRAIMYQVALMAGIRSKELFSMTKESFDLEAGTFTIKAQNAKSRRKDTLPLHPQLIEILKEWLSSKIPGQPLWNLTYHAGAAAKILKKDMAFARQEYIRQGSTPAEIQARENSDFLKWCDSNKMYLDFHSTKTTFVNQLIDSNVSIRDTQLLARHRDPSTTLNHYAKSTPEKLRDALGKISGLGTNVHVEKAHTKEPPEEKVPSKVVLESECILSIPQTTKPVTTDGILYPEVQTGISIGAIMKELEEILYSIEEIFDRIQGYSEECQLPADRNLSDLPAKSCPNLAHKGVISVPKEECLATREVVWNTGENSCICGQSEVFQGLSESVPGGIRTCNLRLRRPTLYPIELRGLISLIINNFMNYPTN